MICAGLWQVGRSPPLQTTTFTGPTKEKLEALEELVIQKVTVSDILAYRDGPLSASWLIRGDGLISVRLSEVRIVTADPQAKTATIILPHPRLLSARVDHERTMFWDAKQGFWNRVNPWGKNLDDLQIQAMREAQRLVAHAVTSTEHRKQAEQAASTVIRRLYAELGWSITIEWQDETESAVPTDSADDQPTGQSSSPALPGQFWILSDLAAVSAASG